MVGGEGPLSDAAEAFNPRRSESDQVSLERCTTHQRSVLFHTGEDHGLAGSRVVHPPGTHEGRRQRSVRGESVPGVRVFAESE